MIASFKEEDGVINSDEHSKKQNDEPLGKQMKSVYLATGLVVDPEEQIHHLPPRHEGTITSRFRWFLELSLSGVGTFILAYIIFTTGQIKTIWTAQYPECWSGTLNQLCPYNIQCSGLFPNTPAVGENGWTPNPDLCILPDLTYPPNTTCTTGVKSSVAYAEFVGIMAGMLTFGFIGDHFGRKLARILTSILMIIGIAGMTFLPENDDRNRFFTIWSIFFAIFGLGVGGEYPLVASGATEQHLYSTEAALDTEPWLTEAERKVKLDLAKTVRRGETFAIAVSMAGVGSVAASLILLALIYFGQQSSTMCDAPRSNSEGSFPMALNGIWRSFYFIGLLQVLCIFVQRTLLATESDDFSRVQRRQQRRTNSISTWKIIWFYGSRLVGTAGNWFLWDAGFYGLKLYSGPIFQSINPEGSLFVNNGLILLQCCMELLSFYGVTYLIDKKSIGRTKLQMFSFLVTSLFFFVAGFTFKNGNTWLILVFFYAASFFGCVANATTFVMAGESYPAELRNTLHGISAFSGKCGALLATIIFGYVATSIIFFICSGTCFIGFFVTLLFSNDYTHVSLSEHDAQLELFMEGIPEAYMGRLNMPCHLSYYELWTGHHGKYDPDFVYKLPEKFGFHENPRFDVTRSVIAAGKISKNYQ